MTLLPDSGLRVDYRRKPEAVAKALVCGSIWLRHDATAKFRTSLPPTGKRRCSAIPRRLAMNYEVGDLDDFLDHVDKWKFKVHEELKNLPALRPNTGRRRGRKRGSSA
jgi:hypothetical protein